MRIEKIKPFDYTNRWYVDEKFIKVRGSRGPFVYLWIVVLCPERDKSQLSKK